MPLFVTLTRRWMANHSQKCTLHGDSESSSRCDRTSKSFSFHKLGDLVGFCLFWDCLLNELSLLPLAARLLPHCGEKGSCGADRRVFTAGVRSGLLKREWWCSSETLVLFRLSPAWSWDQSCSAAQQNAGTGVKAYHFCLSPFTKSLLPAPWSAGSLTLLQEVNYTCLAW